MLSHNSLYTSVGHMVRDLALLMPYLTSESAIHGRRMVVLPFVDMVGICVESSLPVPVYAAQWLDAPQFVAVALNAEKQGLLSARFLVPGSSSTY